MPKNHAQKPTKQNILITDASENRPATSIWLQLKALNTSGDESLFYSFTLEKFDVEIKMLESRFTIQTLNKITIARWVTFKKALFIKDFLKDNCVIKFCGMEA